MPARASGFADLVLQGAVTAENVDAALRKLQRPPRFESLGLALSPDRVPDLDERRNTVQADMRPGERTQLLSAGASEQRHHDVGVHGRVLSRSQQHFGLVEGQRLGRATVPPLRDVTGGHSWGGTRR